MGGARKRDKGVMRVERGETIKEETLKKRETWRRGRSTEAFRSPCGVARKKGYLKGLN